MKYLRGALVTLATMSGRPVVVIPVREGVLPSGALEAVEEAVAAGGADGARVLLIGSLLGPASARLAGHVARVEVVEAGEFRVGAWAAALTTTIADAAFVLLAGSPDGRDLAARLAAAADLPLVAGALSVSASSWPRSFPGCGASIRSTAI